MLGKIRVLGTGKMINVNFGYINSVTYHQFIKEANHKDKVLMIQL